jgi:neopullulanase
MPYLPRVMFRHVRRATWLAVCLSLAVGLAPDGAVTARSTSPPSIDKVEPPNWWPGHTLNPVRLLVRGRHLHGARVESGTPGIEIGLTRVNAAGTALFIDVHIGPAAAVGPAPLVVHTAAGRARVPFALLEPLPRDGRFQGFSADDVIYLIMPDRFANGDPTNDDPEKSKGLLDLDRPRHYHGGDLRGILDRLPYLQQLGITAIWLNPIYDNTDRLNEKEAYDGVPSTAYHGYHAEDFYAVEERFGDLDTLRELVDAAHARGIKVIQDQVANHTGPYHEWLQDPPTPTWFNGTETTHLDNAWQTWTLADPYSTPQKRRATLDGWFIDVLPDLNQHDEEVARYIIQNTLWWMGVSGMDGIRQDTLPYVPRAFWRDWMAAIKREYPDMTVVGELFDGDPALVSFFQGGATRFDGIDAGIDALFDFPLFFPLRRAFGEGRALREVPMMLARDHLYVDPSKLVTFIGLHDVARFMHEPGATTAGLKLAFTAILTLRGIPLIYYGDEIAMRGGNDPDNRRRFPGGWTADARNAFEASGRTAEEQDVFAHVRTLLHARREFASLRRGRLMQLLATEQQWVYARQHDGETVVVAINNDTAPSSGAVDVAVTGLADGTVLTDRLGLVRDVTVKEGRLELTLPGRTAALLVVGQP